MPWLLLHFLFVCSVGCSSSKQNLEKVTPKGEVVILASCDTKGWIEPCGCASGQSGGLSRRATLAKQLAGDRAALLVSAGGATSGSKPYDVEKLRAIVAGEAAMGYAVHNLGLEEILIGIDRISDAAGALRFVSTNCNHPDSNLAERWVLVNRGGWRLLVLGVIQPGLTASTIIDDPESAILEAVQSNRGKFDAVIVLAYMDSPSLRDLSEKLPEVDVIIGGMTGQSIAPQVVGRTLLTAVSSKGKFIARVTGSPVSNSHLSWQADLHEVAETLAQDSAQQANLKAFRERLENFDFSAGETSFVPTRLSNDDEGDRFVGSQACAQCHQEETEIWNGSAHAHAWQTLEAVGAHVDSACQQCHTVGFGIRGGFVNRSRSMDRIDVGCESCHGPSSSHVQDIDEKTPWQASQSCVTCHDQENSPKFEYESYWEQVIHGSANGADQQSTNADQKTDGDLKTPTVQQADSDPTAIDDAKENEDGNR